MKQMTDCCCYTLYYIAQHNLVQAGQRIRLFAQVESAAVFKLTFSFKSGTWHPFHSSIVFVFYDQKCFSTAKVVLSVIEGKLKVHAFTAAHRRMAAEENIVDSVAFSGNSLKLLQRICHNLFLQLFHFSCLWISYDIISSNGI